MFYMIIILDINTLSQNDLKRQIQSLSYISPISQYNNLYILQTVSTSICCNFNISNYTVFVVFLSNNENEFANNEKYL